MSQEQRQPLPGNKNECLEAQLTKHMKTTTDENSQRYAAITKSVPAHNEKGEFLPSEVPSLLTKGTVLRDELDIDDETPIHTEVSDLETMIDTHRDNIEKESSLIWNASELIRNYGIELFSHERPSGDSESESDERAGSFEEQLDDLHEYVFDVSYDAGFQYAYQYPENELISVLRDLWFAPDFEEDSVLVTTLCESRWPGMNVHWVIFTQGVTDAFDCALGDLIGAQQ